MTDGYLVRRKYDCRLFGDRGPVSMMTESEARDFASEWNKDGNEIVEVVAVTLSPPGEHHANTVVDTPAE